MNQNSNEYNNLNNISIDTIDYRGFESRAREIRAETFLSFIKATDFSFFGKFYSWAKKPAGNLISATKSGNGNMKIDADCIRNPATC